MCFDIVQDDRGVFYFATQAGVLQFDGRNWDIIETVGTIYSIARSDESEIYVAGSEGFGKITRDEFGVEVYQVLYKQDGSEYIFQIITLADRIYFLSDRNLFEYSIQTGQVKVQAATEQTGAFVALHEMFGKIYIGTEFNGLFEIDSDRIKPSTVGLGYVPFKSPVAVPVAVTVTELPPLIARVEVAGVNVSVCASVLSK